MLLLALSKSASPRLPAAVYCGASPENGGLEKGSAQAGSMGAGPAVGPMRRTAAVSVAAHTVPPPAVGPMEKLGFPLMGLPADAPSHRPLRFPSRSKRWM